jgi:poly-D-alanine transfer protein DltD
VNEEAKHLKFVEGPSKPKTKTWWVVNKHDDIHLGWIGWFARWRKYAFFPKPETVYEEDCLQDIADFCIRKTKDHKEVKR